MALRFESVTVDAHDPQAQARWWAQLLGWDVREDGEGEWAAAPAGGGPDLLFIAVPEAKTVKNRWHPDLRPDDQPAEVARAEAMGARRVDVGQTDDVTWVVLADPEGNEFCILRALPAGAA